MSAAVLPAVAFPRWVMLEPFVLRRDKEASFPDETKAPVRLSGTTSNGDAFFLAFDLAEPPLISSLYAHLPAFGRNERPVALLSTHRHLALFRVGTVDYYDHLTQDFFVYNASATDDSSFERLPRCTEPPMDYSRRNGRLRRNRGPSAIPRQMVVRSMGILCRGEEFAVAELQIYKPSHLVFSDIYLYKSSAGKWHSMRVPVLHSAGDNDDDEHLSLWQTNAVIPVDRWLCCIDYYRGILFCDVFAEPEPTVSYLRLPLDKFPRTIDHGKACSWLYRRVSAIDDSHVLKFVDVARSDGIGYGALCPGAGFTITCHSLMLGCVKKLGKGTLGSLRWIKDGCTVTSDELWTDDRLPREVPMFPQVNIDTPHVVHFLVTEFGYALKKMWVVAIDMSTSKVDSCSQYVNGRDDIGTEREELTTERSKCPMPFLPCEFTKYLHSRGGSSGGAARVPAPPTAADATDPNLEFLASYNFEP